MTWNLAPLGGWLAAGWSPTPPRGKVAGLFKTKLLITASDPGGGFLHRAQGELVVWESFGNGFAERMVRLSPLWKEECIYC